MERIIIGVDPGTQVTGYGIIHCRGKQMQLISYGSIRLDKLEWDHPDKLKRIFERLSSLIQEFKPQEMAVEAPFQGKNAQSMLKLGRAQGVVMAAGMVYGQKIFEYAPRKIKQAVTGRGSASKEQVAGMLEKMLDFQHENQSYDASDGLAVAVCHHFQNTLLKSAGGSSDWAAFIRNNPNRIKRK